MVKVILANIPWVEGAVRAGSRWPAKYSKDLAISYHPFPFYFGYAAALLEKAGHDVLVLDCLATRMTRENFFSKCAEFNPDLIVVETASTSFDNDMEICEKLKKIINAKIILTGPHCTAFYKDILLKHNFIDFVAVGEYELTILDLAEFIKSRGANKVDGLAYRQGNSISFSQRPLLKNLDELPFPAWHLFPMKEYAGSDFICGNYPGFQLLSSRGCLFKCIFCVYPQTFEFGTFRFNSPQRTVEEMKFVIEKYKPKSIYFDDSTFTMKMKRVFDLCDLIEKNKIDVEWGCMTHAQAMTEELVKKMAKSGCVGIKFGVESGEQNIVYKIGKGLNLEHAKKIFKTCRKYGIRTHATFMFGLPGETKETIKKTMKFIKELHPSVAQFSLATPFPGTKFYEMAKLNNWLIEDDFSLYDGNNCAVISYSNLTNKDLEDALKKIKKEWFSHVMFTPSEIFRVISIAYKEGGAKRVLNGAKRGVSIYLNHLLNR